MLQLIVTYNNFMSVRSPTLICRVETFDHLKLLMLIFLGALVLGRKFLLTTLLKSKGLL